MKNNYTPSIESSSIANKRAYLEQDYQNTISTNFTFEKSVIKDVHENKELSQINRKLNFLKEIEKTDIKLVENKKPDDDYKLIIDLNEFF